MQRFTLDVAADGADVFVAGSGVFKHPKHEGDYAGYVAAIRHADQVVGRALEVQQVVVP